MAYTEGPGWYVQRSFVIPREMLGALATELRKANCLMPLPSSRRLAPTGCLRLAGDEGPDEARRLGA